MFQGSYPSTVSFKSRTIYVNTRTIQKTLKQRCFSDLLALQRALQKGCTNAVFRSLQQCIFVTA